MEKLLKGVDPDEWKDFMTEASKHGLKAGEFLGYLVEEHKKIEKTGKSWEHVLHGHKVLSESDAEKMKKKIAVFEEEYDFEW